MDEYAHTWIAIRSVALITDTLGADHGLTRLLSRNLITASAGAWVPDIGDAKSCGSGQTQHHVLKMKTYDGPNADRFVATRKQLLKRLSGSPTVADFLAKDTTLTEDWWNTPYKADPPSGLHLANRTMSTASMLRDLLMIGDDEVDACIPGSVSFMPRIAQQARTTSAHASFYMCMLSHFVADASMPFHCDARKLAGYDGAHHDLEARWKKLIGPSFGKNAMAEVPDTESGRMELLERSRRTGLDISADFLDQQTIPTIGKGRDVWTETVDICRSSFALSCIIAPLGTYPEGSRKAPGYDELTGANPELQQSVDLIALQDAVINTCMVWKHIWDQVAKNPGK